MLRKLIPVLLSVVAFLGGAAGGEMLRPKPPEAEAQPPDEATGPATGDAATATLAGAAPGTPAEHEPAPHAKPLKPAPGGGDGGGNAGAAGHGKEGARPETAWFQFPQQFFVPVLHDGRLDSTMIMTLSVEMPDTARETVHAHEIKLRDALLRQLLIHANTGGFDGNFTAEAQMRQLRATLTTTAQGVVPGIAGVLIGDIARQER